MSYRIGSAVDDHARRTMASPRIDAALSILRTAGLEVSELGAGHYLVAGRFEFYPASGNWFEKGASSRQGVGARELAAAVKAVQA